MDNYTGHVSSSPVPFQHTNWLLLLPSSDHSLPGIWQVGFGCLFSTSKPTIQWDPSKDWNVARCIHPTLWIKLVWLHITHDYTSKLSASYFRVLSLYAKFAKMEIPNIMGFGVICCNVCQVMSLLCHCYCIVWRMSSSDLVSFMYKKWFQWVFWDLHIRLHK